MNVRREIKERIKLDKLERISTEYFATTLDLVSAKALGEKAQIERLEARLKALEINFNAVDSFDIDKDV